MLKKISKEIIRYVLYIIAFMVWLIPVVVLIAGQP